MDRRVTTHLEVRMKSHKMKEKGHLCHANMPQDKKVAKLKCQCKGEITIQNNGSQQATHLFQTTRLSKNALINLCGEKHSNLQQHPNKSNGGVVRGQAGCGEIGLWLPSPAHGGLGLELVVTVVQEFPS